ncbi:GH36-type glycosyl hydrolase domain-containing protein [Shewanella intestini]|uniref:NdvB protein n=1 Tax=Shewanella intestini TaxID=2017544 RepID=A0ABS5I2I4_9GAMM|nr:MULTISPECIES: NdvB protein [Shewanella]MBR9728236.1 NdvB protein [Shewanella intestini]MRG35701.1 NdvB protein [Shewanella sp. XMDDZSB0408]
MIEYHLNGDVSLNSPTKMPDAGSFLWNKHMMIQMNCRGYATAQFMQPEPAKYAHGPNIEATTFIQPEHPYYSHHPGRFFYIKDEQNQHVFSVPYAPVKKTPDEFHFIAGKSKIRWIIAQQQLLVELTLTLPCDDVAELWQINLTDMSGKARKLSLYSYFPVGYKSWMNQSAYYDDNLNAIICESITPYQKVEHYFANQRHKDSTVLISEFAATSFETRQAQFEGEGGLNFPDGVYQTQLQRGLAKYETPTAAMQFAIELSANSQYQQHFIFAPIESAEQAIQLKQQYMGATQFKRAKAQYQDYITSGQGCIRINSPDADINQFVNHWLPRQAFYHGDVNRLSTDPQTRNYLQDAMGMAYINPQTSQQAFITAISQQYHSGAMPDGILLHEKASLKYINQIPHSDHCVWLIICLQAYLNETNDYALLSLKLPFKDSTEQVSVFEHITLAIEWLLSQRDKRGLSFIAQGDWCDPMNMVGYKGKGVSTWLSLATAYALNIWRVIALQQQEHELAAQLALVANDINHCVNQHCWDGAWYHRGITDDGVGFGVSTDTEGRIFANPQSFALLAGAADAQQKCSIYHQVKQQLATPFGLMMLAPSYTKMREDIGRVTQKYPGTAENGSVYNHAAIFYAFALLEQGDGDGAWEVISKMLPTMDEDDLLTRGQLPVFIPNYYRGAYYQQPDVAGKSSQLFNTGTVAWYYRCIIEKVLGLQGCPQGLLVKPNLPSHWQTLNATREFRGATFEVSYQQLKGQATADSHSTAAKNVTLWLNGEQLPKRIIDNIQPGAHYQLTVIIA